MERQTRAQGHIHRHPRGVTYSIDDSKIHWDRFGYWTVFPAADGTNFVYVIVWTEGRPISGATERERLGKRLFFYQGGGLIQNVPDQLKMAFPAVTWQVSHDLVIG